MPNNKQSRVLVPSYITIIYSIFGFLLVACSSSSKANSTPTSIPFTSVPLTPTKPSVSPTAVHEPVTNTPSPESTISRIATFGKFDSIIQNAVISEDEKVLAAVGGKDDRLTVWNVVTGNELLTLKENNDWNFALSPNGQLLASNTWGDNWIFIRDTQTGQIVQRIKVDGGVGGCAFSPDASMIAISGSSAIWLWDVQNNTLLSYLGPQSSAIGTLAFSYDGEHLVSVGDDTIQLWDLNSREAIRTIGLSREHLYYDAAISPRNPDLVAVYRLSSSFDKNSVDVWDTKSGELILTIKEFDAFGASMAISPDGKFVVVNQNPQTQIWNISSGEIVYRFQPNRIVHAFSTDGRRLVVSDLKGTLELWDVSQLK